MKVYRLAKGWRWLIYILSPIIIGLCSWCLLAPILIGSNPIPENAYLFVAPILVGMITLFSIGLSDTAKLKFVIDRDKIYSVNTFGLRQLMFYEIKGYRATDKYIYVESKIDSKKRIEISIFSEGKFEIIKWLSNHYPDLDLLESEQEEQEILKSEALGGSLQERQANLGKAKKTAKFLNWVAGLFALWALFHPVPYAYAILACISLPLVSVPILYLYKGLIKIDQKQNSSYPSIFWSVFAPSGTLMVRSLMDFDIFDYSNVWIPSITIGLVLLTLIIYGSKEFKFQKTEDYVAACTLAFFMFAYGYGAIVSVNCIYDDSDPTNFHSSVLDKRISTGKTKSYYLKLSRWGNQVESEEASVSKDLYESTNQGEAVKIQLREGLLEIPWFIVTK